MSVVVAIVVVATVAVAVAAGFAVGRWSTARSSTAGRSTGRRSAAAPATSLGSARPAGSGAAGFAAAGVDARRLPELVVEAIDEGVVVVDRGDVVLLANPAARALGALDNDRLAVADLRELTRAAQDDGAVHTATVELTRGWLGLDVVAVAATAVPILPHGADRVFAVALLLTDNTESRRLEAVRRDFVANVSHELKTPVGALTLLAEAVQDAADDPQAVQRFAARMQHEGQRLGRLVGELVALSRVQGADALPDREPVLVEEVIDEAMDRTRLRANDVGITLASSVADGLLVLGDEDQLVTAVANLVDNAVSYSPDGTRVVITGRSVDAPAGGPGAAWVEIAVTDQGMGISESDVERIFERFYRVDPARSRATGGTGLGLSIVKHVVTNHGGTIDVWSAEGAGSTFTVRLPAAAVRLDATHAAELPNEAPAEPAAQAPAEPPAQARVDPPGQAPTDPPAEAPTDPPAEAPTARPAEAGAQARLAASATRGNR